MLLPNPQHSHILRTKEPNNPLDETIHKTTPILATTAIRPTSPKHQTTPWPSTTEPHRSLPEYQIRHPERGHDPMI